MLKMAIGGTVAAVVAISLFAPDKEPLAEKIAASPAGFTRIAFDYKASKSRTRKAMSKAIKRCVGGLDEKPLPSSVVRQLAEGWSRFAGEVDGSHADVWKAAADSLTDEIEALDKSFKRMSSRKRDRVVALVTTRAPELARCAVEGYASYEAEKPENRPATRSKTPDPSTQQDNKTKQDTAAQNRKPLYDTSGPANEPPRPFDARYQDPIISGGPGTIKDQSNGREPANRPRLPEGR